MCERRAQRAEIDFETQLKQIQKRTTKKEKEEKKEKYIGNA